MNFLLFISKLDHPLLHNIIISMIPTCQLIVVPYSKHNHECMPSLGSELARICKKDKKNILHSLVIIVVYLSIISHVF